MVTIPKKSPIVHKIITIQWGRTWLGWCDHCNWYVLRPSKNSVEAEAAWAHTGKTYVVALSQDEPKLKTDRPTYRPKSRREALR